jgi:dTMP kinase
MQQTGKLIVIEGADGSGKTTQVRLLAERLGRANITHVVTAEPTRAPEPVGDLIRSALTGQVTIRDSRAMQLLYAADRLEHVASVIEPALKRGEIVVCDRYDLSTIVYCCSGIKMNREYCDSCPWMGDANEVLSPDNGPCPSCGAAKSSPR